MRFLERDLAVWVLFSVRHNALHSGGAGPGVSLQGQ